MNTEVRKFYKMVDEEGKITFSKAAQTFKVSEDIVEEWARTLEDAGLIKLDYPLNPLESPTAMKKGYKKPAGKKKVVKKPKKVKKKETKKKTGKKEEGWSFLTKHIWRKG